MSDVLIDGGDVYSELDLHRILERQLEFGDYYGRNLAALRDRLLADVPRPVRLIWHNSAVSPSRLGEELLTRITAVFEEAAQQDVDFGWEERFEFQLE